MSCSTLYRDGHDLSSSNGALMNPGYHGPGDDSGLAIDVAGGPAVNRVESTEPRDGVKAELVHEPGRTCFIHVPMAKVQTPELIVECNANSSKKVTFTKPLAGGKPRKAANSHLQTWINFSCLN